MKHSEILIPIRISGLSDGVHEFDLVASPAAIGLPPEFREDVAVHVHLDKTHSQVVLTADIRTSAVFPCDRCLEPVHIPVEQSFALMLSKDSADAKLIDDEDTRVIDPNEPLIDIGPDTRDTALLAIPMRRVCGEDENGEPLCIDTETARRAIAQERPPDTRWEALAKLKELDENE
jgi:uncharacterized metal-binding protein YceD (DUF177 family)